MQDSAKTFPLSILYVEDEVIISENFLVMLSRRFETVYFAENGEAALEIYDLHHPDIILTDIYMPVMNGILLSRAIKLRNPKTPIIITTALNDTDTLMQALQIGIDQFIIKPVDFSHLEKELYRAAGNVLIEKELQMKTYELQKERDMLKKRNDLLEQQLIMARKIQMQSIPQKVPSSRVAVRYHPMEKVGGDFYDFLMLPDRESFGIFLSDTSGHGVPAAFITTIIKSFLLQSGIFWNQPDRLLYGLNKFLINQTGGNFVTAFYGVYHPSTRELFFSNAGHNLPFIITSDCIEFLDSPDGRKGIPLAVEELDPSNTNQGFICTSVILPENSKVLFYTDGLVETVSPDRTEEPFEDFGLMQALKEAAILPAEEFADHIYKKLKNFRGSDQFEDDVCLIALEC